MIDIEDMIRKYAPIGLHPTSKGWYPIVCRICNDHGRKGPRAAFRFENGGFGYHCFNDGCTASFNPTQKEPLSHNCEVLFDAYGVPEDEWGQLRLLTLQNSDANVVSNSIDIEGKKLQIEPTVIDLPPHFYRLCDASEDDKWAFIANDYLSYERGIDPASYPFYLSTGLGGKPRDNLIDWVGRLIIPIYNRRGELIYYQGRAMVDRPRKYKSPDLSKSNVMFGYDEIYRHTDLPIYIVEGFFDAVMIGGCATIGNEITPEMMEHLRRSKRPKVVIPDRMGDGHLMANQAIREGWSVSFPDVADCKDVNEAINRFGKLYVMKSITEETYSGFQAEVRVSLLLH